jgi:DNA-binding transcriptional ArsR family regulator
MHVLDALGNPVRRKILVHLRKAPMPVGAIAEKFDVSRPAISRHLRILQEAGLVESYESGAQNIYAIRVAGFRAAHEYLDGFWDEALARLAQRAKS